MSHAQAGSQELIDDLRRMLEPMTPAPVEVIGTLGKVRHEMSPHRSNHRLVHISGIVGEWVGYTHIATLDYPDLGEKYFATTDYFRGVLPQIVMTEVWKDHPSIAPL